MKGRAPCSARVTERMSRDEMGVEVIRRRSASAARSEA